MQVGNRCCCYHVVNLYFQNYSIQSCLVSYKSNLLTSLTCGVRYKCNGLLVLFPYILNIKMCMSLSTSE